MLFKNSMTKILAKRGYRHLNSDDEFTIHGEYARNIQYVFSKEFKGPTEKIVDVLFLSVDLCDEKMVIGFFRENVSAENDVYENSDVSIPLTKFSLEAFEKALDRLIPRRSPLTREGKLKENF